MDYVTSKGYLTEQNGIYQLSQRELPFDLAFTQKTGIVFVGTSLDQLTAIADGNYRGQVAKHTRRLLIRNKVAGILSAQEIPTDIPTEQLAQLDRSPP